MHLTQQGIFAVIGVLPEQHFGLVIDVVVSPDDGILLLIDDV